MKHNRRCRKLIAILLCICLMVPMISGCGEKKEEETKPNTLIEQEEYDEIKELIDYLKENNI